MSDVQGRVALVTGGTRGIGEAVSIVLKNADRFVVANYAGNEHAAADFFERTSIPTKRPGVSDTNVTEKAFREIEEEYGPVEILVNNAGITRDGTMHRMDRAQWQAVIDTNLSGCFNCSRSVIDGIRERNFGRIVNIGSING
jgi:acetoacetyl-CoA reductase